MQTLFYNLYKRITQFGVVFIGDEWKTTSTWFIVWNGSFCRNRNVCKEILGRKIIAGAKVDALVVQEKKVRCFFSDVCNGRFAVF